MSKIDFTASLKKLQVANQPLQQLDEAQMKALTSLLTDSSVPKGSISKAAELLGPLLNKQMNPSAGDFTEQAKLMGYDLNIMSAVQKKQVESYTSAVFQVAADLRLRTAEIDVARADSLSVALVGGGAVGLAALGFAIHPELGAGVVAVELFAAAIVAKLYDMKMFHV